MLKTTEAVLSDHFRIFETDQFLKDLEKLNISEDSILYKKIRDKVYNQLKVNPYFGNNIKKLRAWKPETWRYRIGVLRLFYIIDDSVKIVSIVSLEKRKSAYRY